MTWKTLSRLTLQVLRPVAACLAPATQVEPDSPPVCFFLPMFSILGVLGWVWLLSVCVGLICPKYSSVSVSELYHPLHIDQPK